MQLCNMLIIWSLLIKMPGRKSKKGMIFENEPNDANLIELILT